MTPSHGIISLSKSKTFWIALISILALLSVRIFDFLTTETLVRFLTKGGYVYLLVLSALFLYTLWRFLKIHGRVANLKQRVSFHRFQIAALFVLAFLAHQHEPHIFRVFYDEAEFLGQARIMHLERLAGVPGQYHTFDGNAFPVAVNPALRPPLFSFVLSLVHDAVGYRPENVFFLNAFFSLICLFLSYSLSFMLTGSRLLALLPPIGLFAFPLFAQVSSSGGYDLFNLTLLLQLLLSGVFYFRKQDEETWRWFLFSSLLLVHCRNESVLYVLVPVLAWMIVSAKTNTWKLSGFTAASPLFLSYPILWNLYFSKNPGFQYEHMREDGQAFFSIAYLPEHLQDALVYLLTPSLDSTNSLIIAICVLTGLAFILFCFPIRLVRGISQESEVLVLLGTVVALAGFLTIQSVFWGGLTDVLASRFFLPLLLMGLIGFLLLLHEIPNDRKRFLAPAALLLFVGAGLLESLPSQARHHATRSMPGAQHYEVLVEFLSHQSIDKSRSLFTGTGSTFFFAHGFNAVPFDALQRRPERIDQMIGHDLYENIFISVLEIDGHTASMGGTIAADLRALFVLEEVFQHRHHRNMQSTLYRIVGRLDNEGNPVVLQPGSLALPSFTDMDAKTAYLLHALGIQQ
ncbi:MAG: hypothetical protein JJT96_02370 [Opitutales bacterium]|nr:hypothetical protein [Opitutales bacterium]